MPDLLSTLNPDQQIAAQHLTGPALVLAGAGSGKTRVLTTRVAWLIQEHKISPDALLLVTFTNKAAGEMKQRILDLTGQILPYSGTFHSLSARILRRYGHLLGLSPNFTIFDSDDQLSLLKSIYKQYGFDPKQYNPKVMKAKISDAKNELLTVHDLEGMAQNSFQSTLATLYQVYNRELTKNQALDFDDLLVKMVRLLQEQQSVRTQLQEQLQYILIDEYQDTNTVQYQLTRLLSAPQENIFVVGDFSQSIYAWRGADYRNMLRLKDDFAGLTEYRLEQNYRSTQSILDAATHVISKTDEHPVLSLWTDRTDSQPLTLIEASTGEMEAAHIISTIKHDLRPEYQYKDVVILYRTNAQSRAFEEACLQAGVPYQIVGGFKFYERKEIKDVLSYARVMVNPEDSVSQARALKLGKRRFDNFLKWKAKHEAAREAAKNTGGATETTHELLKQIISAASYLDRFDSHDEDDRARLENIEELLNVAAQFESLTSFLENIALVQDTYFADASPAANKKDSSQHNALTLMSLHSAKGLEFPVVFMVGLEEGLLPHSRSLLDKTQLGEERRLCYVGITRAQHMLFLSYAMQRWQYGTRTYSTQSRFIQDIPSSLLEKIAVGQPAQPKRQYGGYSNHSKRYQSQGQTGGSTWQQAHAEAQRSKSLGGGRRLVIDDDTLDGILTGEFDIDSFLDQ